MSDIAAREAALQKPWRSLRREREAAAFGIWVFIGSEVMFFGAALLAYAVYRSLWPEAFAAAGRETNIIYGTVNTALLLTSSLTMAAAAEGARAGLRRLTLLGLAATVAFGLGFLVVKGFEYHEDIHKHLVPGAGFRAGRAAGADLLRLLLAADRRACAAPLGRHRHRHDARRPGLAGSRPLASPAFEAAGLYWHFVDLAWIFLYPLLYLVGRS